MQDGCVQRLGGRNDTKIKSLSFANLWRFKMQYKFYKIDREIKWHKLDISHLPLKSDWRRIYFFQPSTRQF